MIDKSPSSTIITSPDSKPISSTTDGLKERLDVSAVIVGSPAAIPIQIKSSKAVAAINANEWQEVAAYVVPTGFNLSVLSFRCHSETAGESARVFIEKTGGTFNCPTNAFTDGANFITPQFGSGMYLNVTSAIGSGVNDTVIITYTNEKGVTGRTCTIVVPKSSLVGTSIEGILEGDDLGVRDITNITHSATGQAGAFKIDMYYAVFTILMPASNTQYQAVSIAGDKVTFPEGSLISLAIFAGTKTSYIRTLTLFGNLEPIT